MPRHQRRNPTVLLVVDATILLAGHDRRSIGAQTKGNSPRSPRGSPRNGNRILQELGYARQRDADGPVGRAGLGEAIHRSLVRGRGDDVGPCVGEFFLAGEKGLLVCEEEIRGPQRRLGAAEADLVLLLEGRAETAVEYQDWGLSAHFRDATLGLVVVKWLFRLAHDGGIDIEFVLGLRSEGRLWVGFECEFEWFHEGCLEG